MYNTTTVVKWRHQLMSVSSLMRDSSQQSLFHQLFTAVRTNQRRGYHIISSLNQSNQQQQQHFPSNHHHQNQYKYVPNHNVQPSHFQQHFTTQQENVVEHLVSDLKKERRRNKRNKIAILLLLISLGMLSYEFWQLRQSFDQRFGFEDLNQLFRKEPSRLDTYLPPWVQEYLKKNKPVPASSDKVDVDSEELKKWVNIAKNLKNQKEYEDAIRILENILWKYPSNFQARELYGLIFLDRGAYRPALRQFEMATQHATTPNSEASCYNNIGVCFSRLKLDKEAVEAYDKALNIAQFDAKNRGLFYFNRAISHNTLGNLQSAIQDYTRSIQFDEQDQTFLSKKYRFRAGCYTTLKQYQKALDDLNLSIQHQQDDKTSANLKAELYYFRAKTQRKLKNYPACITDIDRSIELKKNDGNYFHTRAVALRKIGNFERAEADHNMSIQLKPNNVKYKASLEKTKKQALSRLVTDQQPPVQAQQEGEPQVQQPENKAD